ncbi:hypothetical protein ACQP3J_30305, partial [Escherichia coli]
ANKEYFEGRVIGTHGLDTETRVSLRTFPCFAHFSSMVVLSGIINIAHCGHLSGAYEDFFF